MKLKDMQIKQLDTLPQDEMNSYDGKAVRQKLLENNDLWEAILFEDNDTLYIMPRTGKARFVKMLGETMDADEVDWTNLQEQFNRYAKNARGRAANAAHAEIKKEYVEKARKIRDSGLDLDRDVLRVWWD